MASQFTQFIDVTVDESHYGLYTWLEDLNKGIRFLSHSPWFA